ncbi:MAG TPA: flagellar hook capping FlgD N-terminal domain-containing protein [Acetobacteraceae bacterium]|nr:flagellar hook capping FlgD N-terminal domain-containing protein [Acetobacteraceae bacterium]
MSQSITAANTSGSAATGSGTTGTAGGTSGSNPLASLTSNFSTFLTLLTTQLQNQDPTSPMDSSQFTTELVQFTGVQAQIDTNNSLTQLIQLTQGGTAMQSAQMIGRQVDVTSGNLPLQNGSGAVDFTAPSAGPVTITIANGSGAALYQTTINATQGANSWTWKGQTASGATMPDGAYAVSVTSGGSGTATALPFSVRGTVTGVTNSGGTPQLDLGTLAVPVSALTAVN